MASVAAPRIGVPTPPPLLLPISNGRHALGIFLPRHQEGAEGKGKGTDLPLISPTPP